MSIFDGIFSPQTQTGFGNLMASGALGQLGAGLLSGRGAQGIMSGFGGASNAIAGFQQKAAQKALMAKAGAAAGFSPQQQSVFDGLPLVMQQEVLQRNTFPKFNKDQQLLGALGDPSNPLNAAARTAYDLAPGAKTQLTQSGLNFRHSTVSADKAAGEAGQDRRQAARLSQDEVQDIRSNKLARDKFAQDKFEFGQEYAIKQYRADLDGKKFDRGILESDRDFGRGVFENDRDFAQGVTEFDRTDATRRAGQGVTMRGQDMTAANAQAARQAAAARAPSGFTRTADGGLAPIPGGPADPAYLASKPNRPLVSVNNEKPFTESQAKLALFSNMMDSVSPVLDRFEGSLTSDDYWRNLAGDSALANAFVKTPEYRQYQSAQRQWAEGILRIQTGAAATQDEIDRVITTYFPQAGDDARTVAFKRQQRRGASTAIKTAGQGRFGEAPGTDFSEFGAPAPDPFAVEGGQSVRPAPPAAGAVQGGYRFKGGDPADKSNWEPI